MTNIHPIFATQLSRKHKEQLLRQHGVVIWMVGLSGSGKSTIAKEAEKQLHQQGFLTQLLDGDNLRTGINNNLGFSEEDRTENIRRAAETAKLFLNCGIVTFGSFISPTKAIRELARQLIGADDFLEVYVNAPFAVCEQRDVKGLYAKARRGEIKQFTGLDAPFEEPDNPFLELRTDEKDLTSCTEQLLKAILPRIQMNE